MKKWNLLINRGLKQGVEMGGMETNQIFISNTRIPRIELFKYSK